MKDPELRHLMEHIPLQFPESGFTTFGKQLSNSFVKTLLNIPIEINERYIHLTGKCLTQCRFSGTHIAGKEDTNHK